MSQVNISFGIPHPFLIPDPFYYTACLHKHFSTRPQAEGHMIKIRPAAFQREIICDNVRSLNDHAFVYPSPL